MGKGVEHDDEGRVITVEYPTFFLVNVYVGYPSPPPPQIAILSSSVMRFCKLGEEIQGAQVVACHLTPLRSVFAVGGACPLDPLSVAVFFLQKPKNGWPVMSISKVSSQG